MMPSKVKDKEKKAKVKTPAGVEAFSTKDLSLDQLEQHLVHLQGELEREREERSYFQQERDKIQAFWEICKRNLEETQVELRNEQKERREEQERHRVEITVYKQRLKLVMSQQHDAVSQLKIDAASCASLLQHQRTEAELLLRREVHDLQASFRKKMFENKNRIQELKLKQQVELMELSKEFEHRISEQAFREQQQTQSELEAEKKKHKDELLQVEEKWKKQVETMQKQTEALRPERSNEEEEEEEEEEVKVREKEVEQLHQENNRVKAEVEKSRARQKVTEKKLKELKVEHQLLLQIFDKVVTKAEQLLTNQVVEERDELLQKQTEVVLEVQQRSSLKGALLQRKLQLLTEALKEEEK